MKKIFKFFIVISVIFCLTPIFSAMAQEVSGDEPSTGFRSILSHDGEQGVSLQVCLDSGCCNLCDVFTVASNIFKFLRNTIAFPIVILMIIYGGVMMIFSGGSPQRVKNGKKAMSSALIGFAIVWSVSLILNSVLLVISGAPASFKGFINGDLIDIQSNGDWKCEKDCGSGSSKTGGKEPSVGKDDISGITWKDSVTEGVNNCVMKAIQDLSKQFPNKITVTSLKGGTHSTNSLHDDGKAADLWTNNKQEWDRIKEYLEGQGFTSFCDIPDPTRSGVYIRTECSGSKSTHVHFDMRKISGKVCQ